MVNQQAVVGGTDALRPPDHATNPNVLPRGIRGVQQVEIGAVSIDVLAGALTVERAERLHADADRARRLLAGRIVWHVNATAHGGGVAEMLQSLLAYGRGAGVDTRWLVLDGDAEFFAITKRLHNLLHGAIGDGGPLGEREHAHYAGVLAANRDRMSALVRAQDIVVLHDPQTAGLVEGLRATGAKVVWRCHIGSDARNEHTRTGWEFLFRYAHEAHAFVFSRAAYAPDWVRGNRLWVIAPSIDPLSVKNRPMDPAEVDRILKRTGLLAGGDSDDPVAFSRRDGSLAVLRKRRDLICDGRAPAASDRLVVQVSRWDRLKDMTGVMAGFVADLSMSDVHLMLVGPDVSGVTDDPEGVEVLATCRARWRALPVNVRARVHLACLPMDDVDENALVVNAIQRHACVVVQKSLAEGFGLTVAEALWKNKPVIASAVGGICDQIADGRDGLLLTDPHDLGRFAVALHKVLDDSEEAARLGAAGHQRVREQFLADRNLSQYVDGFASLLAAARVGV